MRLRRHTRGATISLLLALLLFACMGPAQAKRLALVIGNDSYQQADPLTNARADARAVAAALTSTRFNVTLKQDLTLSQMKEALRNFKAQVAGGDEVVFYYSGHGVQLDGSNYLIPIDTGAQSADQIKDDSLSLQRVLDDLQDQKATFALAIIDACRDNPFKGNGRAIRSRGLAPVTAATGQIVLYSAGAGQEALDRLGDADKNPNGVFTRVLIKEMIKPGLTADEVLKNTRTQVIALAKSVNHEQVPALYDQATGEFYFVPGRASPNPSSPPSALTAPSVADESPDEQSFWDRIKDSHDPADFAAYLQAFPRGRHAAEAGLMQKKLAKAQAPTPTTAARSPDPGSRPASSLVAAEAQGLWFLLVGPSTWYWDIRGDGTYKFWSTGPGAVPGHAGSITMTQGRWTTHSPTWDDGGTYAMPTPDRLEATGRLGPGHWQRQP
jgi:hypothetical protein